MSLSRASATGVRAIIDVVLLLIVIIPSAVLKFARITPTQRGFYCDDDSIKYPYHNSTISTVELIVICVLLNVFFFVACELVNYRLSLRRSSSPLQTSEKVFKFTCNRCLLTIVGLIWGFGFGAFATTGLTDIGKYTVGRLRPHFLDACKISPALTTLCSNSGGGYVTNFTCHQENLDILDDLRLSFPSGHASLSAFSMVFLAYYIQQRMPRLSVTYLLKTFIQLIVIGFAWYCALSRVMDYKHHPTDVLAGAVLGTVLALCYCRYVMKSFRDPYSHGPFNSHHIGAVESQELEIFSPSKQPSASYTQTQESS